MDASLNCCCHALNNLFTHVFSFIEERLQLCMPQTERAGRTSLFMLLSHAAQFVRQVVKASCGLR